MDFSIEEALMRCATGQLIRLMAIAAILLGSFAGCNSEAPAIETAFKEYKEAILARDAQKAVMRVNSRTTEYYERLLAAALYEGPEEIKNRTLMDRVCIAQIRHQMDLNYAKQLTGEQLFMVGVQQGWIEDEGVEQLSIRDIRVDGDIATATPVAGTTAVPFDLTFSKENGRWKVDLTSFFPVINKVLPRVISQQFQNEDEFIFTALAMSSGKPVSPDIWDKPKLK